MNPSYHCGACGERVEVQGRIWFHATFGAYYAHEAEPIRD